MTNTASEMGSSGPDPSATRDADARATDADEAELNAAADELMRHGRAAKDSALQAFGAMKAAFSVAEDVVRANLEARPYATLGTAAGVGYVLAGGLASRVTRSLVRRGMKLATSALVGGLTHTIATRVKSEDDMGTTAQQLQGNWMQLKGKLKEAWGALSDNDLDRYEGQLDQLIGHIQATTGEARATVARRVHDFARTANYRF